MKPKHCRETGRRAGETASHSATGPADLIESRPSQLLRWFFGLSLAASMAGLDCSAQTAVQLGIQTYAGLSITGAVGAVCSVEYVTDLAQTNNPGAWRCLELLQLPASPSLWTDKSAPATAKRFYRAVAMQAPADMVFIPPGTFRMGSPANEINREEWEGPQTAVTISRGFWMCKHEVTQRDYQAVMGNNPSYFTGDLNLPVETVSWFDATNYCGQFTQRERAAGRVPSSCAYRLPTEAEWEYACRGLTSDRAFSYGDDLDYSKLNDYGWYGANSLGMTHPVGQKLPNPWGLYDMHGNVREWCQDWYGTYAGGTVIDPHGPATGSVRVIRGGVWLNDAALCRSAYRDYNFPSAKNYFVGFRVVLAPEQP